MSLVTRLTSPTSWVMRLLAKPHATRMIVLVGLALTLPSIFTGFHLDDLIGRFIFSDLPGAERLYKIYAGGYGAANGNPEDAAWMMEEGYAPWWMDPQVLLAFFRPISLATHLLDAELWPNSALLWHVHSWLWFGVLLLAATRTYLGLQGTLVGGLAALLFAVDHTHGLPVGFITNRYILIATALSLLALHYHAKARSQERASSAYLAWLCYGLALLSGESSAAIVGYLVAYALFLDSGTWLRRARSLAPYFVITLGWRILYNALGRGARGSDLYIDPAREPLRFLLALIERAPMLLLGQWFAPPAETYTLSDPITAAAITALAWLFAAAFVFALWPVLKSDRVARFWATGMALAIVPMCSGEPNNRMLFVAGIGAAGLLAQWASHYWEAAKQGLKALPERFSRAFAGLMLIVHLVLSPVLVPIGACSLVLLTSLKQSFDDVGEEAVGREAVFVTVPDYFAVRLMRMTKEVEGKPTPDKWRALSFGPEQITVTRTDARTLVLDYEGGAMNEPAVTKQRLDLYRSQNAPMHVGERVELSGLSVEVLSVTADGRPLRARFRFAESLDAPRYQLYHWVDNHFRPYTPPPVGGRETLPKAILTPEWPA